MMASINSRAFNTEVLIVQIKKQRERQPSVCSLVFLQYSYPVVDNYNRESVSEWVSIPKKKTNFLTSSLIVVN